VTALQRLFAERGWHSERLVRYVDLVRPMLDDAGPRGRALLSQLDSLRRQNA
jgi:hypothetical protein